MPSLTLHALALVLDASAIDLTPIVELTGEPLAAATSEGNGDAARSLGPLAVRLDLDLSTLPAEDVEHFEPAIRDAIDPLLDHERFLVTADTPHQLVIHVALLEPAALDYVIDFEVRPNGRLIAAPTDRIFCRICAQVEVVEHVAQGLPHALSALRAAVDSPLGPAPTAPLEVVEAPPPVVAIEPTAPVSRDDPSPPSRPRLRWLGPVGTLGIVLAVGGTATVAFGTVVLHRALRSDPEPIVELPLIDRDPQRWGWALVGMGLAVTAAGGVMLATDVTVLRERRARRLHAHATLTPTQAGLVVRGRF